MKSSTEDDIISEDPHSQFLKVGDVISFFTEEAGGYLCAEGFADNRIDIQPLQNPVGAQPNNFRDCLFRIHSKNQYIAKRALRKSLHKSYPNVAPGEASMFIDNLQDESERKYLQDYLLTEENERSQNQAQQRRQNGKVITYGETFQLLHVKSENFVSMKTKEVAELQKDCFKVCLTDGDEDSWFKVIPRYKVRSEGEKVRIGDQIILVGAKNAQYLHASKDRHSSGHNEVNASDAMTRWKVQPFSTYSPTAHQYLQGGSVVRLLHKETEAFMIFEPVEADDDNIHLRISEISEDGHRDMNSNALWEVELEEADVRIDDLVSKKGGIATTDKLFRFRHMGTLQYLAATAGDDMMDENEDTLFEIHPMDETKAISHDSVIRIRHHDSQFWLHSAGFVGEESRRNILNLNRTKKRQKLVLSERLYDEDAYSISPVEEQELRDLDRVVGMIPRLRSYSWKLSRREKMSPLEIRAIESSLVDLISFCSLDHEQDPFKREGLPLKNHQKLLREQKVIPVLMNFLEIPFSKLHMTIKDLEKPANKHVLHICKLTNRLLWHVLRENRDNGIYMFRYINTFQEQVGYKIGTNEVIREVYRDNRLVLEQVTDSQIDFWIDLLARRKAADPARGGGWQTLGTIAIFCSSEGAGLPSNQDLVFEKFVIENHDLRHPVKVMGGIPFIEVTADVKKWVPLSEFAKDKLRIRYFLRELQLVTQLCIGRNHKCIATFQRMYPYEFLTTCLVNDDLPANLRKEFADMMLNLYINVEPQETVPLENFTRLWKELKDDSAAIQPVSSERDFADMKNFISTYLKENCVQVIDEKPKNELTLAVLNMCHYLIKFGFYSKLQEIQPLISILIDLLDGSSDVMSLKQTHALNSERHVKTANTLAVMEAKERICQILLLFSDLRADLRLTKLLKVFKQESESSQKGFFGGHKKAPSSPGPGESVELLTADMLQETSEEYHGRKLSTFVHEELERIFKFMEFRNDLVYVLLDLTLYQYPPLVTASLTLLYRHFKQKMELMQATSHVQLLVSEENVRVYKIVMDMLRRLMYLKGRSVTSEESMMKDVLAGLVALCTTSDGGGVSDSENQRLLRNLRAYKPVIEILESYHKTVGGKNEKDRAIAVLCYKFLRLFVIHNRENQNLLYDNYFDFLLNNMMDVEEAVDCIRHIVLDNRLICSRLTEEQIRRVITTLARHGQYPRYLRLLQAFVVVDGRPMKTTGSTVVNMLIEHQKETIVLFNTESGIMQRNDLMEANDHIQNKEGLLNYHVALLDLLADCSGGMNEVAELKCQALLSIEEIVRVFSRATVRPVKAAFLRFLDEVYVRTEKKVEKLKSSTSLWNLLETFVSAMDDVFNVPESEISDAADYIFQAIIPLLNDYFWKHYPETTASKDQIDISNRLADSICTLFDLKGLTRSQLKDASECLRSMKRRKITGNQFKKKFEEILEMEIKVESLLGVNESKSSVEDVVSKSFFEFCRLIENNLEVEKEFSKLIEEYHRQGAEQGYIARLINHLWECGMACETHFITTSLRVLQHIVEFEPPGSEGRQTVQNRLNNLNASQVVIRFLCVENDDIVLAALSLANALLDGGSKSGQESMYNYLQSVGDEVFFQAIRSRIHRGGREIKERRQLKKRLVVMMTMKGQSEHQELVEQIQSPESGNEGGYILEILRFLQLLCEGHNLIMQNYLRNQKTQRTSKSIDLVSEIVAYLMILERNIDGQNIEIAIQLFDTLTELVQGPCYENQVALVSTNLCDAVNRILRDTHEEGCSSEDVSTLKSATLQTLTGLLEGHSDSFIIKRMVASLDFKVMCLNLEGVFTLATSGGSKQDWEALEVGFLYFILMRILIDADPEESIDLRHNLEKISSFGFFDRNTGRIEIVRHEDLERVYFPILPLCRNLSEKSKQSLLWEVNRDTPEKKIEDFYDRSDDLIHEMEHEDRVSKLRGLGFLTKHDHLWKNICFFLTLVINITIFTTYDDPSNDAVGDVLPPIGVTHALTLGGYLHLTFSTLSLISFVGGNAPLIIYKMWKTKGKEEKVPEYHVVLEDFFPRFVGELDLVAKARFYWQSVYAVVRNRMFIYHSFYFLTSVMGNVTTFYYFSLHLYDIVIRNRLLQKVTQSVTENGKSLLMTALLGLVIVYQYAILAVLFFREDYMVEENGENYFLCESMALCVANTFYLGLTNDGGIAGGLQPIASKWNTSTFDSVMRFMFDLTFFIVVITILMNIIFGIIIDTFAAQRDKTASIEEDIDNRCFICHIERDTFDRQGQGFEHHIKNDHNIFDYLYFIFYLKKKDPTEYTGPESYVHEMVQVHDLSFFPLHKAMCVDNKDEDSDMLRIHRRLQDRVEHLHDKMEGFGEVARLLSSKLEEINTMVQQVVTIGPQDLLGRRKSSRGMSLMRGRASIRGGSVTGSLRSRASTTDSRGQPKSVFQERHQALDDAISMVNDTIDLLNSPGHEGKL